MLLAAAVCAAVVVCSLGLTQEAATATANSDTWTLTVQSAPVSGVVISGTHPGASNYAVSDGDCAAVTLTAPESWMDGSTLYEFVRWTVNGSAEPANQVTVAFSLSAHTTATAEYRIPVPTITVTRPNGGEQAQRGAVERIGWSWTGDPGPNVKIALYKGGVWNQMITSSTPNDGWFSCAIPCSVAPGSDYKVKITSTSALSVYDFSDGNFGITSFKVTAPGCGVSWKRGTTHSITWTSKCSPGPNVKLALYKGGVWVKMIASSTPNDGSYSWAIPANTTAGSDYKVRVTSLSNTADWRASDCAFSITQ
jgi:5-hydroxyisourate hydrolase-like protein (transthyretin family)